MEDDWDLTAVVRGCSTKPTTTFISDHPHFNSPMSSFGQHGFVPNTSSQTTQSSCFSSVLLPPLVSDPIKPTSVNEELHDLYKPFFPKSSHHKFHNPPLLSPTTQITPQPNFNSHLQLHSHQPKLSATNRSKKRKNMLKKVCQVPAESLSSDVWAWRKYGQKPIKGSPYPRGYYKCSSSKGCCMARKQVERHRSDPGMFIVTYTAEHNHPAPSHRNSLAGSTRLKPAASVSSPRSLTDGEFIKPKSPSSPATSAVEEVKEEKHSPLAHEEEEAEFFGVCGTIVSDDFFVGLDGLAEDYFSGHFTASFAGQWNAATAASSI